MFFPNSILSLGSLNLVGLSNFITHFPTSPFKGTSPFFPGKSSNVPPPEKDFVQGLWQRGYISGRLEVENWTLDQEERLFFAVLLWMYYYGVGNTLEQGYARRNDELKATVLYRGGVVEVRLNVFLFLRFMEHTNVQYSYPLHQWGKLYANVVFYLVPCWSGVGLPPSGVAEGPPLPASLSPLEKSYASPLFVDNPLLDQAFPNVAFFLNPSKQKPTPSLSPPPRAKKGLRPKTQSSTQVDPAGLSEAVNPLNPGAREATPPGNVFSESSHTQPSSALKVPGAIVRAVNDPRSPFASVEGLLNWPLSDIHFQNLERQRKLKRQIRLKRRFQRPAKGWWLKRERKLQPLLKALRLSQLENKHLRLQNKKIQAMFDYFCDIFAHDEYQLRQIEYFMEDEVLFFEHYWAKKGYGWLRRYFYYKNQKK
jgi:hypothetical protein